MSPATEWPTRLLGHSGIEVTTVALGAMMFGAWGNEDVDECRQMVHCASTMRSGGNVDEPR